MQSPSKRLGQASKSDPLGQGLTHLSDTDLTLSRPQEPPLYQREIEIHNSGLQGLPAILTPRTGRKSSGS